MVPASYGETTRPKEERQRWKSAFRTDGPVRSSFLLFEIYGSTVAATARDATRRLLKTGSTLPYGGETVEEWLNGW